MCVEFRREALAFIGENFDGGDDHEGMWKRTIAHVLGPVPTTKVDPECSHDELLRSHSQEEIDRCVEILCAVMELQSPGRPRHIEHRGAAHRAAADIP